MQKPKPLTHCADSGICPFCGAFAQAKWGRVSFDGEIIDYSIGKCQVCSKFSFWSYHSYYDHSIRERGFRDIEMIYPRKVLAPSPHLDMPAEILVDFEEARAVCSASPRAAAALLRLCLQKLLGVLEVDSTNINNGISQLVARGLPVEIQQSLDIVRVVGNESVHPGQIDLNDDSEIVFQLFEITNIIVQSTITQPKRISEFYQKLPQSKRDAIDRRDTGVGRSSSADLSS